MVDSDLKNYLVDGISKGYTIEQLKAQLLTSGFGENVIDGVIAEISSKNSKEKVKLPVKKLETVVSKGGIKKRNVVLVVLFSLITFGIYPFYWLISTNLELRRNTKSAPSLWLIFTPMIFLALFFIVAFFTIFFGGALNPDNLLETRTIGLLIGFIVVFIASIVCGIIFYWKYSKAVEELTGFSGVLLFFLWIIFAIVAIIFTQLELNKKAV